MGWIALHFIMRYSSTSVNLVSPRSDTFEVFARNLSGGFPTSISFSSSFAHGTQCWSLWESQEFSHDLLPWWTNNFTMCNQQKNMGTSTFKLLANKTRDSFDKWTPRNNNLFCIVSFCYVDSFIWNACRSRFNCSFFKMETEGEKRFYINRAGSNMTSFSKSWNGYV